jgi:phage shock protein A
MSESKRTYEQLTKEIVILVNHIHTLEQVMMGMEETIEQLMARIEQLIARVDELECRGAQPVVSSSLILP